MGKVWDWITGRGKERKWSTEESKDNLEHIIDMGVLMEHFQAYIELERKYGATPSCPLIDEVYQRCMDNTSQYYQTLPENYQEHCKCYRMKNGVASSPTHLRSRVAGWQNGCYRFFSSSELMYLLAQNTRFVPDVTDYGANPPKETKKAKGTPEDVYGESW